MVEADEVKMRQILNVNNIKNQSPFCLKVVEISIAFSLSLIVTLSEIAYKGLAIVAILIGAVLLRRPLRTTLSDWVRGLKYLPQVSLNKDFIQTEKEKIMISTINNLIIEHNYVRGRSYGRYGRISNGLIRLTINRNSGNVKIYIVNETLGQRNQFRSVIHKWYKRGLKIKEFFLNERISTFALEPRQDMSYKEIKINKA